MVNKCYELANAPQRSVQRNLVQIFYDDIVVVPRQMPAVVALRDERVGVTRTNAVNTDPVQIDALWNVGPGATKQVDPMTETDYATEYLVQMQLGAAGLGIGVVLPVENEYPH